VVPDDHARLHPESAVAMVIVLPILSLIEGFTVRRYVVLDWNTGDLEATRDHNHGWQMLALLADKVLDLEHEHEAVR